MFPATYIEPYVESYAHWTDGGAICPHYQDMVKNLNIPEYVRHIMRALMLKQRYSHPCVSVCGSQWENITRAKQQDVLNHAPRFAA